MARITAADEPTGVQQVRFIGRSGLARMQGRMRLTAIDADAFHAEYQAVRYNDSVFESLRLTSCSGTMPPQPADERETVRVGTIVAGGAEWRAGGLRHAQDRGLVHLIRGRDRVDFVCPEPTQFLGVEIPVERLPDQLAADGVLRTDLLPRWPVVSGFSGFLRHLAAAPGMPATAERAQLAHVLDALVLSVLSLAAERHDAGVADLRLAIHHHIERHLSDPDLGPRQIAAALDVSVRWVHRVFNVDGQSIAKHIRDRRVDEVAAVLRSDPRVSRMGYLSEQFGFGGRDQLARAFRARYGTTVREYQELAISGAPLPPPLEAALEQDGRTASA